MPKNRLYRRFLSIHKILDGGGTIRVNKNVPKFDFDHKFDSSDQPQNIIAKKANFLPLGLPKRAMMLDRGAMDRREGPEAKELLM